MKKLCLESNEETSDLIITGDIAAILAIEEHLGILGYSEIHSPRG